MRRGIIGTPKGRTRRTVPMTVTRLDVVQRGHRAEVVEAASAERATGRRNATSNVTMSESFAGQCVCESLARKATSPRSRPAAEGAHHSTSRETLGWQRTRSICARGSAGRVQSHCMSTRIRARSSLISGQEVRTARRANESKLRLSRSTSLRQRLGSSYLTRAMASSTGKTNAPKLPVRFM
jgi:hypothetical protein